MTEADVTQTEVTGTDEPASEGLVAPDGSPEERGDVIDEALGLIDQGLADLLHRELVSSDEVSDLLLDVRTLLTARPEAPVGA